MIPEPMLEARPAGPISTLGVPREAAFVILANGSWDQSSRINCHHIASRIAEEHPVLFVESIGARRPSLASTRDLRKIWQRVRSASRGLRIRSERLAVLSPLVAPGFGNPAIDSLNARLLERQIRHAVADWTRASPLVLWVFTPSFAPAAALLKPALCVYQCVDEHAAYPGARSETVRSLERELIRRADVTLTTSRPLYESRRALTSNLFCLPNVADTDLFGRALDPDLAVPPDLRSIPKPIVGFIGNVSDFKIDTARIRRMADLRPDISFVLIGEIGLGESRTDLSGLRGVKNLHLLGPRRYESLPAYLKGFDVCMIPFAFNRLTESALPMKLFEYMASGKPIVATATPPLLEYGRECYLADDDAGFLRALQRALAEPPLGDRARARIASAAAHGWNERMSQLGVILGESWGRREGRGRDS